MSTTALTRTDATRNVSTNNSYTTGFAAPASQHITPQNPSTAASPSKLGSTVTNVANALPKISLSPHKTPSTPASAGRDSPRSNTPGAWQHPRLEEVIQRQNATRFDGSNVRIILLNAGLIGGSTLLSMVAYHYLPSSTLRTLEPWTTYIFYFLQALFTVNIIIAISPLFRPHDTCEDIPLTPAQRAQLGLPPMTRNPTPQETEQYVTPPRYSRSNTPQSGSSLRAEASGSPLSARSMSNSPFASAQQQRWSPLGTSSNRRSSFLNSSPLGGSEFDAVGNLTPTKMNNKASVGLNNKWLYEKGRRSPRSSSSGLAGFGGTGSVFL